MSASSLNESNPETTQAKGQKPRILILTSSTGGGHDSRAYSLKEWLGEAAEVHVEHLLEKSSWLPRFGVWVYNTIQKIHPGLHNIYWFIAEGFARMQGQRLSFGRAYYLRLLGKFRPQLIVSMHDCLNRGYFQEAKAQLGNSVRTCTYCGEWSGGFGFSLNWLEPTADLFIARTGAAQLFAVAHGMRPEHCEVFRNMLPPRAFVPAMDEARKAAFREELGLEADRFTVLLAAGAAGANNHIRLLDKLLHLEGVQAIAFCGKSEKALSAITRWKEAHPAFPLHVEGYSKRVHELLQAADCVVSRGGANTTAEALYHGCPILFNRMGGVMPQERLTLNYFIGQGAALDFTSAKSFEAIVRTLSSSPGALRTMKRKLLSLRTDEHPRQLVERLLKLALGSTSPK
ncbi:MAG: glycosyltransferase [Opitutales bacterium]|nr:glycosyltransferase [Opitutales bacterium]